MSGDRYESWGRFPRPRHSGVIRLRHRLENLSGLPRERRWLAFGNGRSYGDSCLNEGGLLLDTRGLDRFLSFDRSTGLLACECGVLLSEIIAIAVPQGWFLSVTPGTQFVTLGGAIANDVHGKNHHARGTFGNHVVRFELLRSDGSRCVCSREDNPDLFRATIGGLGLTGVIQWAEIRLRRITSPLLQVETIKFESLDEFVSLATESDRVHEYTVAWIDSLSGKADRIRGHFMRADHAENSGHRSVDAARGLAFPVDPSFSLVNRASLQAFNTVYYHRQMQRTRSALAHFQSFFYPLDRVAHWNRMYGRNGFMQFQCVVPERAARDSLGEMLAAIAAARQGSFLSVLKRFGAVASPGMLSFPRPGVTLALDFPNIGPPTLDLLDRLEAITMNSGGALYPAKDARMSGNAFRRSFPTLHEFTPHLDPQFSSSFWRRVSA